MKLRDYLADRRITQEAFAQRIGLSQGQVSRVVNGTTNASLDVLRRISVATEGQVTPNDFLLDDTSVVASIETGAAA